MFFLAKIGYTYNWGKPAILAPFFKKWFEGMVIKYYVSYITGKMSNERTIYIQCLRYAIAILKLEKCENLLHGKLNTM